jgi:hypothetical protein
VTYTFKAATKQLVYVEDSTERVLSIPSGTTDWASMYIMLSNADSATFSYSISKGNAPAAFRSDRNNQFFAPADPISFADQPLTTAMLRIGAEKDAAADSTSDLLWSFGSFQLGGTEGGQGSSLLQMENGYFSNMKWINTTIPTPWGGYEMAPAFTFAKGASLTVSGDPDGEGPIMNGQVVRLVPIFSQVRSRLRPDVNDCAASLHSAVTNESLSLPGALSTQEQDVKTAIGNSPVAVSLPLGAIDGTFVPLP